MDVFLPKITNNCRISTIFGLKHQSCLVLHDYKVFETTNTLYFVFSVIFVQFWTTFPQQNVWYLKLLQTKNTPKITNNCRIPIIFGFSESSGFKEVFLWFLWKVNKKPWQMMFLKMAVRYGNTYQGFRLVFRKTDL